MTGIEAMYLADRLAAWAKDYDPYEPTEDSQYYFTQIGYQKNRKRLLEELKQIREEMSVDNEADRRSFEELNELINEIKKI